ncbi:magnesium-translocating P-type ATPase [Erysipelothrix inopinata]|uniref:Magnesium-transporting ATPase, P-type 1 n=1 Tax=Erysipelothrix inopinata TaxID=225084 RepID=A0A7G9RWC2_9FIRM|nr:magnesium-translocating P-type ATPase [Erysipelothrix inopinata]QNN59897.1 magnesium-translocating P-type ATPase [Erysipelothrix inopinata]
MTMNKKTVSREAYETLKAMRAQDRLKEAAILDTEELTTNLKSTREGLQTRRVDKAREDFGENKIKYGKEDSVLMKVIKAFINPFTSILIALALVSGFTDIILAEPGEADPTTVIIITLMVLISGILRYVQEAKSNNAAEKLSEMVETTTLVERRGEGKQELPIDEVVVGDMIYLSAGDMIPADMRILEAKDLFITQAALTGESEHIEKNARTVTIAHENLTDNENLVFMGSDVISGAAKGIVVAVGSDTLFGSISENVAEDTVETSFEKGVNSVSWLLIRFMLVMVPIVLFLNGFTKGDWMGAFLFAISVAVGLTPEMLPMIVTTSLAKGAVSMSKEKTIVKSLNSIQNIGAMDILCTDKTGTLTQDRVVLEYHLDVLGNDNDRVLRHAYLNSYFQTGLKNLMDKSIIEKVNERSDQEAFKDLDMRYHKVDEVPFDFNRRRMSVVVSDKHNKRQMITKGAVEEMLNICSYVEVGNEVVPLKESMIQEITKTVDELNEKGMRVIALAQKTNPAPVGEFSVEDEREMVLMGYLAFLDPPKESAQEAIEKLAYFGVTTKVITGDNEKVTRSICNMIGLENEKIILGSDVENFTQEELNVAVEKYNIFAKMSPSQKALVVETLRDLGHTVGFMGDGINDAPAMKAADIGISVDTGVDIAKESAEVILLEKDLLVLEKGIIEGRKTYANMIKYIKMTASSNFGNVFSVLIASAFLPFLPMEAIHLVLLNLIYDISCIAIPWDNVDEEFLRVPRKWDATSIRNFMIIIGPTSSVFDITTYLLMFYIIGPQVVGMPYSEITSPETRALFIAVFQAGWFVESMWSQTLVIHMIRTPKIPFLQSRASTSLTLLTFAAIIGLTVIPFTGFGASIGLAPLPLNYFFWLAITIVLYMVLATIAKNYFIKRYGELL